MPTQRMQYAQLPSYQYQSFDIDYWKFTNAPVVPRKKPKKEPDPPPAEESVKVEEEKKNEIAEEPKGKLSFVMLVGIE